LGFCAPAASAAVRKNTNIVPHLCVREEVLAMLIAGAMQAMGAFDVAIPVVTIESTPLPSSPGRHGGCAGG
jgi:hypothetical protein